MKDNIFYYFYEKNTCIVIFSSYWLLQEALIFVLENDPVPCSPNKKTKKAKWNFCANFAQRRKQLATCCPKPALLYAQKHFNFIVGIIMLVYVDLDTVEEIIKPNYLVMRVEKNPSCVPKCATKFKYKL